MHHSLLATLTCLILASVTQADGWHSCLQPCNPCITPVVPVCPPRGTTKPCVPKQPHKILPKQEKTYAVTSAQGAAKSESGKILVVGERIYYFHIDGGKTLYELGEVNSSGRRDWVQVSEPFNLEPLISKQDGRIPLRSN